MKTNGLLKIVGILATSCDILCYSRLVSSLCIYIIANGDAYRIVVETLFIIRYCLKLWACMTFVETIPNETQIEHTLNDVI